MRPNWTVLALLSLTSMMMTSTVASAAQPLDCASCRERCQNRSYPDNARPDLRSGGLVHRSPEARAAFEAGVSVDPGLGGTDARRAVDAYKQAVLIDGDNAPYRNHLAAALLATGLH